MKKILKNAIFVMICILIVYICIAKPMYITKVVNGIQDIVYSIFEEKVPVYDKNIAINSLKIRNSDYYYNNLTLNQKRIYDAIFYNVKELKNNIKIREYEFIDENIAAEDINCAMEAFFDDHPEVFYLNSEYKILTIDRITRKQIELNVTYSVANKVELDEKINEIEEAINRILEQIELGSSFNNELKVHDKFANIVKYYSYDSPDEIPEHCHNIYGTLVKKQGVCDGFTKSMQILLNKVGIESIFVSGILEENPHAWNLVNIDGNWYHLDVTSNKSLHLKSDNIVIHSYFNITTDMVKKTHTIKNEQLLPNAISTEYNYYMHVGKYIYDTEDMDKKLKKLLDDNIAEVFEVSADRLDRIPNRMSYILQNNKYSDYITSSGFKYYMILNSYVMIKNKS